MKHKYLQDSAILVFGVTIAAYTINLIYEFTRLQSYGVSPDLIQVKMQNFLITGFLIGFSVVFIAYLQRSLFRLIEKKVKSEVAANYTKEELIQILVCSVIGLIFLFGAVLSRHLGQEEVIVQLMQWGTLVWVIGVFVAIGRMIRFFIKAKITGSTYSKIIDQHYAHRQRPIGRLFIDVLYGATAILSLIIVPTAGFAAAYTTHDMYVIKTGDTENRRVIIGVYGDGYIVKDYDVKAGHYRQAYTLVEMRDKEVEFIKNGF